ncbi:hypothetical protein FNO01nite_04830 [Flavobacterium noncentrifugens]|uniref:Lipoprotein n=1 Tax=Flavobacterium noncentrifugens TaxID=1128970 RepID=A0A1G8SFS8_9FLAO|nr:hypothetical protein [Flavobacterium noncentrifugens]GEP49811.1 hypothetical protein FNO01nite_04830 [Flavobacterium noncentrifugens]SDJ28014.1 hypothetical protein SAMN04487935_0536 [Flavobacterium noncentrifugens]
MKKIIICLTIVFTAISCETENEYSNPSENAKDTVAYSKAGDTEPQNPSNPYDMAGQVHNQIAEHYIGGPSSPPRILLAEYVDGLALQNPDFAMLGNDYMPISLPGIVYILNNSDKTAAEALGTFEMSNSLKQGLLAFIQQVAALGRQNKDYSEIYNYIVSYETGIIAGTALKPEDKKAILTLTSITRYSSYFAKKQKQKPRDRDWDVSVGCLVACLSGTTESTQRAVTKSLVSEILINE